MNNPIPLDLTTPAAVRTTADAAASASDRGEYATKAEAIASGIDGYLVSNPGYYNPETDTDVEPTWSILPSIGPAWTLYRDADRLHGYVKDAELRPITAY